MTRISWVGAKPMNALESANTTTPNRNIERRPKMSPIRPPVTSNTANVSVYALTVHSSDEIDAWRSRWIEGSATFTTVLSSMIMNSAKHMAASVHHLRLSSFRRMRSGIWQLRVLSGDAQRRDVLARDDGGECGGEALALVVAEGLYEVGDAGDAKLDQAACLLASPVGRPHGLVAPVLLVLGPRDEAALDQAVDGAAHGRHREAHLVGDRRERGRFDRPGEQVQDADLADAQV